MSVLLIRQLRPFLRLWGNVQAALVSVRMARREAIPSSSRIVNLMLETLSRTAKENNGVLSDYLTESEAWRHDEMVWRILRLRVDVLNQCLRRSLTC